MLDAITDFWKPVKKAPTVEKLNPDELQIGSSIGFGFVPQALLSGRRLLVSAINTYQFGDETLTSFVLTQDKEPGVSMIVAESEGEHYLAISRRISISDRMKLFDSRDLENVMDKQDITKLPCKDNGPEFKGWTVATYKREIQGLKGRIYKGDFRKQPLAAASEGQEFEYYLLVSDSNEHAIEIEKYSDGRIEVYATIYRRMSDIGEISHPARTELSPPNLKFESMPVLSDPQKPELVTPQPVPAIASSAPVVSNTAKPKELVSVEIPPELIQVQPVAPIAPKLEMASNSSTVPAAKASATSASSSITETKEEKKPMNITETAANGATKNMNNGADNTTNKSSNLYVQPTAPQSYLKQEVKAVSNPNSLSNFDADSIECDLRVANKIIDEAIRNEMRLTDVVRRIIELPVAYPESVQIPMTLTDEDYALLGIRYSIAATDRNAIKRRILEDLNDFSGGKKAAA